MNAIKTLIAIVLAMIVTISFAQTVSTEAVASACDPQATKLELEGGGFACVFGLSTAAPSPESVAAAKVEQDVHLTAKKAAAEAYLEMDVIKMVYLSKSLDGLVFPLSHEAYPKKGKFLALNSSSYCDIGLKDTTFSITAEGNLAMYVHRRMSGCLSIRLEVDPITKQVYRANASNGDVPTPKKTPAWKVLD